MKVHSGVRAIVAMSLFVLSVACAADKPVLEGTWRMISYFRADNQVRYACEGYMMFGKAHWLHLMYLNRDERLQDFSEAHHGTYQVTGAHTLDLSVDMELHMDPKSEFQKTPVWYEPPDAIKGARYHSEGNKMIMDLPSSTQLVMQKIE